MREELASGQAFTSCSRELQHRDSLDRACACLCDLPDPAFPPRIHTSHWRNCVNDPRASRKASCSQLCLRVCPRQRSHPCTPSGFAARGIPTACLSCPPPCSFADDAPRRNSLSPHAYTIRPHRPTHYGNRTCQSPLFSQWQGLNILVQWPCVRGSLLLQRRSRPTTREGEWCFCSTRLCTWVRTKTMMHSMCMHPHDGCKQTTSAFLPNPFVVAILPTNAQSPCLHCVCATWKLHPIASRLLAIAMLYETPTVRLPANGYGIRHPVRLWFALR